MDSDVLVALFSFLGIVAGAVVGVVGGYFFGVGRSRSERRDEAIAEIFKEMMLFYRGIISWTADPSSNGPITEPGTLWRDYCRKRYALFLDAYFGNGIWLGRDTYNLIQEFAHAGKDVLNEFQAMNAAGYLPDGTRAWDRRAEILMPKLNEVEDALRAEMEESRYIIPYRIVSTKNEAS